MKNALYKCNSLFIDEALLVSLATDLHKNFVTLGAQAGIGQTRAIIKRKVLFIER